MNIAQTVIYHPNGFETLRNGQQSCAAIVTAVNGDLVDLTIFPAGAAIEHRKDILPGRYDRNNNRATYEIREPKAPAKPAKETEPSTGGGK